MSLRKLLPVALLLAAVSIRCAGSPAAPIGTVSVTQTTTTTTTSVIPGVDPGTVNVLPGLNGLAGATVMTFAFGTQPSGGVPPYTVQWNFGDGQSGSGTVAPHTYQAPGIFIAAATVNDSGGRSAQAFATVTIHSVTGTWRVEFQSGDPKPVREKIDLLQDGGAISASTNDGDNLFGLGSGSGTVANPRALTVRLTFPQAMPPPATSPVPFAGALIGQVDSAVTTWTGTATGYPGCPCDFTATRTAVPGVLSTPAIR
ncbi:MAG TPA: PKD domain-containing protein [Vicinamibacterales bacterium]|nr:PKD domain-containing protein [Vicinamibacterales bacterium]